MTTQSRIQEIAERCEKASPAPWHWNPCGLIRERMASLNIIRSHNHTPYVSHEDARFIAAARTDIPFLLEQLAKAVEVIEKIGAHGCCVMHNDRGCPGCTAKDFLKEMRSDE